jgi:hypothetical protein
VVAAALLALAVLLPTPAAAKVPTDFTVEIEPGIQVAGEPLEVIVRLDRPGPRPWNHFLWAFPDGGRLLDGVPVRLAQVRPTVYEGTVEIPTVGRWNICLWAPSPCEQGAAIGFDVAAPEAAAPATRSPDAPGVSAPLPVLGAVAVVGALALARRRRRSR